MSHRILDVQNKMDDAVRAFEGLNDLFREVDGKAQFESLRPGGVSELISLVGERFLEARDLLDATADEIFGR
jgi:hypothetical protein